MAEFTLKGCRCRLIGGQVWVHMGDVVEAINSVGEQTRGYFVGEDVFFSIARGFHKFGNDTTLQDGTEHEAVEAKAVEQGSIRPENADCPKVARM